jgi:Spy/CpxP family protein refolding chaperone
MKSTITLALSILLTGAACADDSPAECPMHASHAAAASSASAAAVPAASAAPASPYAGHEHRGLKALPDEQIKGYTEGRGMGLALPAELHHYPGPRHVLDASRELALTPPQVAALEAVFGRMKAEAVRTGAAYVAAERELDAFFAEGGTDLKRLATLTHRCAVLLGELRATHLAAHVETRAALTPAQVAGYDRLRGYGEPVARVGAN